MIRTRETFAHAFASTLANNTGIKCPFGCRGSAARLYGLVKHLMEKHGKTEKQAWKMATQT